MNFEHNPERDAYLEARGKVVLNACPGSGKTITVAYKLTELTKSWQQAYSKFIGIACLSFTNVAKDQINDKYTNFSGAPISFPHIVSTIDSFINQYITLPFYYLFMESFTTRPTILDDAHFMDEWYFPHSISKPDTNGRKGKLLLKYRYPPSSINTNLDGTFSSNSRRPNLTGSELAVFCAYCEKIKCIQYSKGLLKTTDSTVVALQLIEKYPRIASMLANRFPYVIIDEAQDTSEIQYAIIDRLIQNGLQNIELVGDPYQSIFEWREACPDLFWKRCHSADWQSLELNDCRRSVQDIVDCYSILRQADDAPLRSTQMQKEQKPVRVLLYDNPTALLDKYRELSNQYDDRCVLVRGQTHLELFEAKTSYESMWKIKSGFPHHLILASFQLKHGHVRDAVNRIRRCLPTIIDPDLKIECQRERLDAIKSDPTWNARIMRLLCMLPSLDTTVVEWTAQMQSATQSCLMLEKEPDFELKQGPMRPKHKLPIRELYSDAPNSNFVTTIHQAKGKTFDSVLLVLAEKNQGQNICLSNIERPNGIPDEKKRLIYVAMSRPRYQLVIAVPKGTHCTHESTNRMLICKIAIDDI